MKKQITSTDTWLNTLLVLTALIALLLGPIYIEAQVAEEQSMFSPIVEMPVNYDIKEFTFKKVNNDLYFKFLVLENEDNTNYILESSSDGKNFQPLQRKEGFKSPSNKPLLYSYKINLDNKSLTEIAYRIRRISPDGNECSDVLKISKNNHIEYIAQNN